MSSVEWWTVQELADRWRISTDTVLRMLAREDIKGRRFGHQWRISRSNIEAYEQGGKKNPTPIRRTTIIDSSDPLGLYQAPSTSHGR